MSLAVHTRYSPIRLNREPSLRIAPLCGVWRACRPNLPLTLASLLGPAGGEVTVTDPIFSRDGALQLDVRLL